MSTEKVSVVISSLSYHLAYFLPKPDQNHSLISPLFFARLINVTFWLFLFFLSFLTFSFSFPEAFRLIRLYLPLLHMLMIFVNKVACIPLKGENRATRRKTYFLRAMPVPGNEDEVERIINEKISLLDITSF